MTMPTVAVVGGSLGGLTTALLLADAGCDVDIYERSRSALEARGAGIAVLEQTLRYPIQRLGHAPDDISTQTTVMQFLGVDGTVVHTEPRRYRFSAWNTIYRVLHDAFPLERYHLGQEMTSFSVGRDEVEVAFADHASESVDLLVCADGIGSSARSRLLPDAAPSYAGYVAWRGTVPEASLSDVTHQVVRDAITYQVLADSHILVYPIPGPDGSVEEGHRLINLVWYRNVTAEELPEFMTGSDGVVREVSVPPGLVAAERLAELRGFATDHLAPPIAEVVTQAAEPFVQAIFDIEVSRMASGRACLIGDAAFAVRPHAAAGTAKAAEDGWVLAEELASADGDVEVALPRWEARQLALGSGLLARNRAIGDSSQFAGGFRPGDPRLVFGLYGPGR